MPHPGSVRRCPPPPTRAAARPLAGAADAALGLWNCAEAGGPQPFVPMIGAGPPGSPWTRVCDWVVLGGFVSSVDDGELVLGFEDVPVDGLIGVTFTG